MGLYIYYNTNDSAKEPHGKLEAINLEDATKIASHMKQLEVNEFLKLFTIESSIVLSLYKFDFLVIMFANYLYNFS